MQTSEPLLSSIDSVIGSGKAVISADNSVIISMVLEALKSGRSATFYISRAQFQAVGRWFWTPKRLAEFGMEPVSQQERARIVSELHVKDMGEFYSNRIECPCGGVYGAFEFMEQGLREHGKNWLGAVLAFENAAVLRINPTGDVICPHCNEARVIVGHSYWMGRDYGCCRGEI